MHLEIYPVLVLSPVIIIINPGIHADALPSAIEEQDLTELVGELVLSLEHASQIKVVGFK